MCEENRIDLWKRVQGIIPMALLPVHSPVTDTHTIPNLLEEMDLLGIEKAVRI